MGTAPHLSAADDPPRPLPLVVELEGALVTTEHVVEAAFGLARRRPTSLLALPLSWARGRAELVRWLVVETGRAGTAPPYDPDLVRHLEAERRRGRPLVLMGRDGVGLARLVSEQVGPFDQVVAAGPAGPGAPADDPRGHGLQARIGSGGFDYAGEDSGIRARARRVVWPRPAGDGVATTGAAARIGGSGLGDLLGALRPLHWLKNGLVLVPLIAAHRLGEIDLLAAALLAVVAFCLCASGTYLLNDLLDLASDRRHPHKRRRAIAAGRLGATQALGAAGLLVLGSGAVALCLPWAFAGVLALYSALTLIYSLWLKDLAIADVLALAVLHTLRIGGGAAAVGIVPSAWLLAFSVFLFFSLAMIKRYAELMVMQAVDGVAARARAYRLADGPLLAALGGASGYLSVLVLALYIGADPAETLYQRQYLLWLICLLLLHWISHVWLMAHRGHIRDDPLLFALRDRVSRVLIILMALVMVTASLPGAWP